MTTVARQRPARRRRRLALLATALAAIIAAVLVVALSSGGGGHRNDVARTPPASAGGPTVIALAARYLHMTPARVRALVERGDTLGEIAAAKGKSPKSLVEAIYRRRAEQIKSQQLSPARERAELAATRRSLAERVARRGRGSSLVLVAAGYLGLTRPQLNAKLAGGHTLASLAEASSGRSRAGLIAAMTRGRRESAEAAAKAGRISPAVAKRRVKRIEQRAERIVDAAGG